MDSIEGFGLESYKPLGEVVFEYLRNAILSGKLKPGERLMEVAIADQIGVSRTPVREAIRKLEKEKFVIMIPRKGAYVADLTSKDIYEVLEIRRELEGFAAALAAERMEADQVAVLKENLQVFENAFLNNDMRTMIQCDNEFHDLIFTATKNNKLIDIIADLHDQFQRFRLVYFDKVDNYQEIFESHTKIYNAIEGSNTADARTHAQYHIDSIEKLVDKWMSDSFE